MKYVGFLALALLALAANAESLYVSDKLVIGVFSEANQESEKLASLESGDSVEVLEKAEGYMRVRLADGREGWIKSSYLTTQAPAILRVKQLEKEQRASSKEVPPQIAEQLKQLQEQNNSLKNELNSLKQTAASLRAEPLSEPKVSKVVDQDPLPNHALIFGGAILVTGGAIGFALGYRIIVNRIRRKYGSLKIY